MIVRAVCPILVGREDELSALEDVLLAACRGEGSVALVAGEAGVGKSRLCHELARRAKKIGATVIEGSCSEAELAMPYLPFLVALGNYISAADITGLRQRLGPSGRELGNLFPKLSEERTTAFSDAAEAKQRLFDSILALLEIAAENAGLLLVLEDLHWADASTRELVDYLTRRLRESRILLLATFRRDEMHRKHPLLPVVQSWRRIRLASLIELEPLSAEGIGEMVTAIFDDPTPDDTRDFLFNRCEGTPFVLEEMLKVALDRGDIYRDERGWARKPLGQFRMPESVRDSILARIEKLSPDQVEILRAAAVLGMSVDYSLLANVCGRSSSEVEDGLETFCLLQLLEEDPDREGYRFRHALTREAIYESLSMPRRERLHGKAAEALQQLGGSSVGIAHHLIQAGRPQDAVPFCLDAADREERACAYSEAVALRRRALPHVQGKEERAQLLSKLGEACWRNGDVVSALEYLEDAATALPASETASARILIARCRWELGHGPEAEREFRNLLESLGELGASRNLALTYMWLARLLASEYGDEQAEPLARLAIAVAEQVADDEIRIWTYIPMGLLRSRQGRLDEASGYMDKCYAEAMEHGFYWIAGDAVEKAAYLRYAALQPRELGKLIARLSALPVGSSWRQLEMPADESLDAMMRGDLEEALRAADRLSEASERLSSPAYSEFAKFATAWALTEQDRLDAARAVVERLAAPTDRASAAVVVSARMPLLLAMKDNESAGQLAQGPFNVAAMKVPADRIAWLVEGLLVAGKNEEARQVADQARLDDAWLWRARALIAHADGDAITAIKWSRGSASAFREAGDVPDFFMSRLILGKALAASGAVPEAIFELTELATQAGRLGFKLRNRLACEELTKLGVALEPVASVVTTTALSEAGERLVTVMFADVRGYTAMTGERTPADMADRIAAYQRWATLEVERNSGAVDKFAGDAVMATFNIAGTQVDHVVRALRAALALRDKAALLGLPVGIGIATGAAVVGRLAKGANLSVLGDTTNLASRLQAEAKGGEVLMSEEAYRRVKDQVEASPEVIELKGVAKPVTAYRLKAPQRAATQSDAR